MKDIYIFNFINSIYIYINKISKIKNNIYSIKFNKKYKIYKKNINYIVSMLFSNKKIKYIVKSKNNIKIHFN